MRGDSIFASEHYLVELFERFVKVNNSNDQSEDFFREARDVTNHETAFKGDENDNEERRPQTNTAANSPEIGL
jgi:hypothetical protein